MQEFTVIIPCWCTNEEILQLTKNTIDNLGKVGEIVIIDNGSTMGGGYLRSVADVYIRNQENKGYAYAVNQGLKICRNELVCVSNNDIVPSSNWQEVAIEVLGNENVYSCHYKMVDYDKDFGLGDRIWYGEKERWCTSSFFVINRAKYLLYYDENYFNSYCDWDYWYTVRKTGLLTAYTNKAAYKHKHSSSQKYIPEREENDRRNKEYFKEKWGGYAETLFEREYPLQMRRDYKEGFE